MHFNHTLKSHWRGVAAYLHLQLTKQLLMSCNMNYPRKNPTYLKQVYTFQTNQIKFQNPKFLYHIWKDSSFINNLKSEETKSQIKAHLLYLPSSYFYNYKPSPCILRQHCVLRNLRKNKDIIIVKPNKGNEAVNLDWKLSDNAIQEIILDTSKFKKLNETQPWNMKLHYKVFYVSWSIKTFLTKMNMMNCILLVLLLLISMVLLKCTNFPLVIHFQNFVQLLHL